MKAAHADLCLYLQYSEQLYYKKIINRIDLYILNIVQYEHVTSVATQIHKTHSACAAAG